MERKPMNGREMQVVEYMTALDSQLMRSEALRERLKQISNGWRQMRLIVTACDKLLRQIYETMTPKNLAHIENISKYGEAIIRFHPAAPLPEYKLLPEDDLREMLRVCILQECSICLKEGKQAKRCKLRAAMMNVAPLLDDQQNTAMGCGYQAIARGIDEELQEANKYE